MAFTNLALLQRKTMKKFCTFKPLQIFQDDGYTYFMFTIISLILSGIGIMSP